MILNIMGEPPQIPKYCKPTEKVVRHFFLHIGGPLQILKYCKPTKKVVEIIFTSGCNDLRKLFNIFEDKKKLKEPFYHPT